MAAGHYFLRMSNVRLCWPPRFSGLWVKSTSKHRQQQPGAPPPVKNAATSEAQMPVRDSQEFPSLHGYQVGLRPPRRGRVRQLDLDLRGHPQWVDSGQSGGASAPYTYCWLSSPQTTGCRIDSKVGSSFVHVLLLYLCKRAFDCQGHDRRCRWPRQSLLLFRVRIETTNFEWYFGKCSSRFSIKHFIW